MGRKKLRRILRIPVYLTSLLIVAKFIIFKIDGSLAILSLCLDSFFDFISSCISLIAYKYSTKEKTEKYQYGFYGIVDIATVLMSMFVIVTAVFIFRQATINIISHRELRYSMSSVIIMVLSTIFSVIIILFLKRAYNNTKLIIIKGEMAHHVADAFTNGGVLLSILICKFIYNHYLIDPIIAIFMGFLMLKPAVDVLCEAINNILAKEIDSENRNRIINILNREKSIIGFKDMKTRRSGERIFVQIHLQIDKNLSFNDVHNIVKKLEKEVENNIENSEIIIHACPA